jgi:hypothetical protein
MTQRRSRVRPGGPPSTRQGPGGCVDCAIGGWTVGPFSNYDHVHAVDSLPHEEFIESPLIHHGYAVGSAGTGPFRQRGEFPQNWVFFRDFEPAIVHGRSGRMSCYDITSYGVYEAAHERRIDNLWGRDVTSLYIRFAGDVHMRDGNGRLSNGEPERQVLLRWVRGCDPASSYFEGAGRTGFLL